MAGRYYYGDGSVWIVKEEVGQFILYLDEDYEIRVGRSSIYLWIDGYWSIEIEILDLVEKFLVDLSSVFKEDGMIMLFLNG